MRRERKKFKRMLPLVSPGKIGLAGVCLALAAGAAYLIWVRESPGVVILGGFGAAVLFCGLMAALPGGYTYAYDRDGIRMFFLGVEYRRVRYGDYAAVLVSNAAYNNGPGHGAYANLRMEYVSKGDRKAKTVFPYLTLHRTDYPIWKVRAGLYSREVGSLAPEGTCFLGIGWFASLAELMERTEMPVYILEDVYLRFRGAFDAVIAGCAGAERVFIVTDRAEAYGAWRGRRENDG